MRKAIRTAGPNNRGVVRMQFATRNGEFGTCPRKWLDMQSNTLDRSKPMKTKQRQTMKSTRNKTISIGKYVQPEAMVNAAWVAEVYQNGWGVPQDYSKAYKWFEKAAAAGNRLP